jgi:hypothetical protein
MEIIKNKIMWQYYIILALGFVFLIAAIFSFRHTIEFLNKGNKATATVIDLRMYESEGKVYAPTFTFLTSDNELITYELPEGSDPPAWKIGETETIIYDPANPSNASLYSYFRLFTWTLVLVSIALPLLVIGAGYFIAERFFL